MLFSRTSQPISNQPQEKSPRGNVNAAVFIILLLLMGSGALVAVVHSLGRRGALDQTRAWSVYDDHIYGFSISYPPAYVLEDDTNEFISTTSTAPQVPRLVQDVIFKDPSPSSPKRGIILTVKHAIEFSESTESEVAAVLNGLEGSQPRIKMSKTLRIGDSDASRLSVKYNSSNGSEVHISLPSTQDVGSRGWRREY
jgi:hypothetical protein